MDSYNFATNPGEAIGSLDLAQPGGTPSFLQGVGEWGRNLRSGDRDYQRELYLQGIANAFTAEQNKLQYEREREFRQTAYQDQVADMLAAGLNPYLAYGSSPAQTAPLSAGGGASAHAGKSGQGIVTLLANAFGLATSAMRANAIMTSALTRANSVDTAAKLKADATKYSADKFTSPLLETKYFDKDSKSHIRRVTRG